MSMQDALQKELSPDSLLEHIPKAQDEVVHYPFSKGATGYDVKINYLIKGYLPTQSFGVLFGPSGHYKSFHAVSWACAIAAGKSWNGEKTVKGTVLYIVGEGGLGAPRRFQGWEILHNNSDPLDNLFKINGPVYPANPLSCKQLLATVDKIQDHSGSPVQLIVIDTLARCFAGADENRSDEMGAFIAGCDYIKHKTGATILVVHHTGKNVEAGARGSSALRAACDFEYEIRRVPEVPEYILSNTKSKDSCEKPKQAFSLLEQPLFTDDDGDEVTTLVGELTGHTPPDEAEIEQLKSDNHKKFMEALNRGVEHLGKTEIPCRYIRDDLRKQGMNVKHFGRWMEGLMSKNLITVSNEMVSAIDG